MIHVPRRALTSALTLTLALTGSACAPDVSVQGAPKQAASPAPFDPSGLAELVTIHRDAWGTPHVHGATDAAAAFGFGYAQAEDNLGQVEENFVRAVGRASELHGEETFLDDWINRSLRIEELARAEYEQADGRLRALLDGYAAGLDHFVVTHPEAELRLLDGFEPWYPLALIRYLYYQRGFLGAAGITRAEHEAALSRIGSRIGGVTVDAETASAERAGSGSATALPRSERGSNSWAVTPERSADGRTLLFINPHLPFFGPSQVYEGHLSSDEGWNFTGYSRLGFPLPYVGFNEHLAWASTDNAADLVDVYVETFDHPEDPLAYRYGDRHRRAEEWTDTIRVRAGDGVGGTETRTVTLRRTHHGPVLALRGGRPLAVRMAKLEEPGWLDQWYAMTRARDLEELRSAASRLDMLFGNYLYADREGHVFYVYNAAVPVRSEAFDWSGAVDGSDPATEWRGYHPMEDLPQVVDPPAGWVQNCNGSPFLATVGEANPDPADFPSYMVPEQDNARSANARRILASGERYTFERWVELSYDTFSWTAADEIPVLSATWERLREEDPERAAAVAEVVGVLRDWDRVSTVDSVAATLFVHWFETRWRLAQEAEGEPWLDVYALEEAIGHLEERWGTWRVPWGQVNRLQRVASNGEGFDDAAASLASPALPSWAGSVFTMWSSEIDGERRRYGAGGNSYVAVLALGEDGIEARSLLVFGPSADPDSPHHLDQGERWIEGDYKPAWLTLDEVRANAERSYRPGEESSDAP